MKTRPNANWKKRRKVNLNDLTRVAVKNRVVVLPGPIIEELKSAWIDASRETSSKRVLGELESED